MRFLIYFILFLFPLVSHAYFEEQEVFLPNQPGKSEFFYNFKGEKYVTRIDKSVNSFWTPSEEQIEKAETVKHIGEIALGMSNHFIAIVISGGQTTYRPPWPKRDDWGTIFKIGDLGTPKPTWTKEGNHW